MGRAVRGSVDQHPFIQNTIGKPVNAMSDALTPESLQQQIGAEGALSIGLPMITQSPVGKMTRLQRLRDKAMDTSLGTTAQDLSARSHYEGLRKQAVARTTRNEAMKEELVSFKGAKGTTKNANKLVSAAEAEMDDVLTNQAKGARLKVEDISKRLDEKFPKDTTGEQDIAKKILEDISKLKTDDGFVNLKQARKQKTEWNEIGFRDETRPTHERRAYRKAAKVVDTMIAEQAEAVGGKKALANYRKANLKWSTGLRASVGANKKAAKEEIRSLISMPNTLAGAATGIYSRDPLKVAAAMLLTEGVRRHGPEFIASALSRGIHGAGPLQAAMSRRKKAK